MTPKSAKTNSRARTASTVILTSSALGHVSDAFACVLTRKERLERDVDARRFARALERAALIIHAQAIADRLGVPVGAIVTSAALEVARARGPAGARVPDARARAELEKVYGIGADAWNLSASPKERT